MRSFVIVEFDSLGYLSLRIFLVRIHLFQTNLFVLDYSILSFSNGIISWIIPLCHADTYMMADKKVYIVIACILRPSIRVVYRCA